MGKHRALPLAAGTALLLVFGFSGTAAAHYLGEDSVDTSGYPEIQYEDYTRWNDALTWSDARWSGLGGVNIGLDDGGSIADLEVRDYNRDDGNCGYWSARTGADLININDRFFNGYSTTDRRACMLHEFGHSLRLAHSYSTQVMDDCPVAACGSVYTYPQSHDQSDFYGIW